MLAQCLVQPVICQQHVSHKIPFLHNAPKIDGDLSEWKMMAFGDGEWNLNRVKQSAWYESKRNKLTVEIKEDLAGIDLTAEYFIGWDHLYFYFGAEVCDNILDVDDSKHENKRWYYKDAIAWFIEFPRDSLAESFGDGDHAFCFVLDTLKPNYGAWWRHGNLDSTYIEEALPKNVVDYVIRAEQLSSGSWKYTLEARVDMSRTFGLNKSDWKAPVIGDSIGLMLVHCDPDGGDYGGHLLIYGKGDNDSTWTKFTLTQSVAHE
jgi:hypothetical protein